MLYFLFSSSFCYLIIKKIYFMYIYYLIFHGVCSFEISPMCVINKLQLTAKFPRMLLVMQSNFSYTSQFSTCKKYPNAPSVARKIIYYKLQVNSRQITWATCLIEIWKDLYGLVNLMAFSQNFQRLSDYKMGCDFLNGCSGEI